MAHSRSPPEFIKGEKKLHEELCRLILDSRTQTYREPVGYDSTLAGQRLTVIITVPKSVDSTLGGYPGHVGIALWNTNNYTYTTRGISANGTIGCEFFKNEDLDDAGAFEVWYFTKSVAKSNTLKMLIRMRALGDKKTYGAILSTRFIDTYNCITVVDSILWAGGESWGTASCTTPYLYSCTFGNAWTQSRIDGARHMLMF